MDLPPPKSEPVRRSLMLQRFPQVTRESAPPILVTLLRTSPVSCTSNLPQLHPHLMRPHGQFPMVPPLTNTGIGLRSGSGAPRLRWIVSRPFTCHHHYLISKGANKE